jgi:hypothetical protein
VTAPPEHGRAARYVARSLGHDNAYLVRVNVASLWHAGDLAIRVSPPHDGPDIVGLAELALEHGVPTAEPIVDASATVDGLQVTVWRWLAAIDAPIDWCSVGTVVRRLHGIGHREVRRAGLHLRTVTDVEGDRIRSRLAQLDGHADCAVLSLLSRRADALLAAATERPCGADVLLHGDLNPGNVMTTPAGPVLVDWELARTGAPEWDHTPLLVHVRRFGVDAGRYEDFVRGYGRPVDAARTETMCRLRELSITLGQLRRSAFGSQPADREEAQVRLRYWTDPDVGAQLRWTAR